MRWNRFIALLIHNLGFGKCYAVDVTSHPLYFSSWVLFEASVFGNGNILPPPAFHKRAAICFCRKEALSSPTDVSYTVGQGDQESTANTNSKSSKDSLSVTNATSSSPQKASQPRVANLIFILCASPSI